MEPENNHQQVSENEYLRHFLKEPPLILHNFHHEDVMEFLKCGIKRSYEKDKTVINEDDFVNSAFLVSAGNVAVWKENIQLASLGKGTFLGEMFLFSKNNRMAKIVATEDSTLIEFDRAEILNFFRKKPEKLFNIFIRNIIQIQQNKISNMNGQLFNLKKRLLDDNSW